MRKSLRPLALAIVPLVLLGTACGSDDDSGSDSTDATAAESPSEESSDAESSDAESSGDESSSSNPDVEAFCDEVDEFVTAMEEILADPASGDAAELATQGQELATSAQELAGSVDAEDADRLQECTAQLSDLGS
jgi:hypothetical protein